MALLFTAYRGFNVAVSRPKAVMVLQLGALLLKVPLTALLVFGAALPGFQVPALGAPGCGIATAIVMTGQMLAAWLLLQRDPFYLRFGLRGRFSAPHRASLAGLLRLGVPMGLSILIEITGFTFMAFFISRIGTIPVAGHQIAVNLVAMLFMMPLAIANASSTLVAQRVGADDAADARRLGWHSLEAALLIAALMGGSVYLLRGPILQLYTHDPVIVAAALPLLDLGRGVPRRRRGADGRRVRAARLPHRHGAAGRQRLRDLGRRARRRLCDRIRPDRPEPGLAAGRARLLVGRDPRLICAALAFTGFLAWMFREQRREEQVARPA